MNEETKISETSIVKDSKIGVGTKIWEFCNIYGCEIGNNCMVGSYTEIQSGVKIGNNVKMLMPDPFHSNHNKYIQNHITTGKSKIIGIGREVKGKKKDGKVFPVYLSVGKTQIDGETLFVGILIDITKQKAAETAKSEFISTVSHELRTPLTSIKGALGLLIGGVAGDIPPKASGMLNIANQNCERLIHLINDLIDIDKIQSGKMNFDFEQLNLIELVKNSLMENQGYADRFGVKLNYVDSEKKEIIIKGDKHKLLQVMANLLSNAVKFSNKEDIVEVSAKLTDKKVRILIKDNGSGIPVDFKDKLFQKFVQVDSSDTKKKGGTGLGLAITKQIIEKHGGTIDFTSSKDKGTVFYFELYIT